MCVCVFWLICCGLCIHHRFSKGRFLYSSGPKGGILADEMGLGKTVEVLALILAHKWPGEDQDSDRAMCDTVGEEEEEEGEEEEEEEEETLNVELSGEDNTAESMDCNEGLPSLHREDSLIVSISHEGSLMSIEGTTCVCTDQDQRDGPAPQTMPSQTVALSPTDNVMVTVQHDYDITERDMDTTEEHAQLDVGTRIQTILDKVATSTNTCNHLMSPTLTAALNDSNVSRSGPVVSPSPGSQARTSLSKSPLALGASFQCSPGNSPDEEEDEEEEEEEEDEEEEEEEVEEGSGSLRTDSPSIQEMIRREHSYSSLCKEETNPQVTNNRDDGIVSDQPPASSKDSEMLDTLSASHEDSNKVSLDPSKECQSPTKVSQSPTKVSQSPSKECQSPTKVSQSSTKVSQSPSKECQSPTKVSQGPTKVSQSPTKVSQSPTKVSQSPTKVSQSPTKVSQSPTKVSQSPTKVSQSPSKECQSPTKVSQSPTKGGGSSGSSQEVVRCLCGATSEGSYEGEFVQCERCQVWQHSHCADFHATRHDMFICIKCLLEQVSQVHWFCETEVV